MVNVFCQDNNIPSPENKECDNFYLNVKDIDESQVAKCLSRLKNKFTSGVDQIPSFLVRDCVSLASPLCTIFNLALKTCRFPDCWKTARVCPVLKSGDAFSISNYRPISILPNFAKVFEMTLYTNIYPYIQQKLSPFQHGFMEHRSTVSNLLSFSDYVSSALDKQVQVDVVYTDFSKAFDRISHQIILNKLSMCGFSESLVCFFESYLTNRTQFVSYNGHNSEHYVSTSGVPQGSNLGPLMFLVFINDIVEVINCEKLLFADDLKIYSTISNQFDCLALQNNLNKIQVWCDKNNLQMNVAKCKVISYSRCRNPILFNYTFNSSTLQRCDSIRDLGVVFDSRLTFHDHISHISACSMRMLGFIIRNSYLFSNELALKCLYFSFVRSKLEYCSLVWYPYYNVQKNQLESIQRKFLKFLNLRINGNYPERGYPQAMLLSLFNVSSLELRRILSSLKFLYFIHHNRIDCQYLLSKFNFLIPRLVTRYDTPFHLPRTRSNILYTSPIYIMSFNFNQISSFCDLHFSSCNEILKVAASHFGESI